MARALVAVLALAAACSRGATTGAPAAAMQATTADEVVATVDGRPIYAGDVARQARARGVDARTALDDLVTAEALAGAAEKRGLEHDLEVVDETKGALVRRYLASTFEKELTPADVPEQILRKQYQKNLSVFSHSTYADVWNLVVPVAKNASAADKEAARARAVALARRARGMTLAQLKALGDAEGLHGEEDVTARDGWTQHSFSEAAFTQLAQPGDVTLDPPLTTFGYHVEYLIRFVPAANISFAEAAPKLRNDLFPTLQKRWFDKWADDARARHRVEVHPEHLPRDE